MYDFISLILKCPVCGKSLMDNKHLVDNKPSIKLNIEIAKKKGVIWLSSIYGSFNYDADIEMVKDEIAKFICPQCDSQIISDTECLSCGANMVPFYLDMGGKVTICSRSGCKNHLVEFEDLSIAMKKLYQEYGYAGKETKREQRPHLDHKHYEEKKDEVTEIIESGTFLHAYCPDCKKSLIEEEMLKLKITNGEDGYLMLSPYLNVFSSKSTIFLPEDKIVKDLKCYHCNKSLIVSDKKCGSCGSPIARIAVSARTKLIDFYICTKKGCRWHGLNDDDYYDIRLEDSLEW
jgi:ssDNA-binding Zn-finger/Zn-ribbon topoisomerase 1